MDEPPTTSFSAKEPPALAPAQEPPALTQCINEAATANRCNDEGEGFESYKSTELSADAPGHPLWSAETLPSANAEGAILPRKR